MRYLPIALLGMMVFLSGAVCPFLPQPPSGGDVPDLPDDVDPPDSDPSNPVVGLWSAQEVIDDGSGETTRTYLYSFFSDNRLIIGKSCDTGNVFFNTTYSWDGTTVTVDDNTISNPQDCDGAAVWWDLDISLTFSDDTTMTGTVSRRTHGANEDWSDAVTGTLTLTSNTGS